MLTQIMLIRHGKPTLENCLLGSTDCTLSSDGIRQLETATTRLEKISKIISSPLKRCSEFASKFSEKHQLDLSIDDKWQECDFGDWDGMNYAQLAEQFPEAYHH
ncbi:MAG: histidine phosphatase family protein, partial [Kangiellaceae bacterium]